MGNMRPQPEPFHMLQEFGHRNKHPGVNSAHGKETLSFQEHRPNYCARELSPRLQAGLQAQRERLAII